VPRLAAGRYAGSHPRPAVPAGRSIQSLDATPASAMISVNFDPDRLTPLGWVLFSVLTLLFVVLLVCITTKVPTSITVVVLVLWFVDFFVIKILDEYGFAVHMREPPTE
jgi:hypothetical protein